MVKITGPTQVEIAEMQSFYDQGNSVNKVVDKFPWSKVTVLKYLKTRKPTHLTEEEFRKRRSEAVIGWRRRAKQRLVEYKGGKCEVCGYNKSIYSLTFHHKDPTQKDFSLSGKSWSFERLQTEVDKCRLLCNNCHGEVHEQMNEGI